MEETMAAMGDGRSLREVFEDALLNHGRLEQWSGTQEARKDLVGSTLRNLELALSLVSAMQIYSTNEALEDITTSSLRFLLIEPMMADIVIAYGDMSNRRQHLERGKLLLDQFLFRCQLLGLLQPDDKARMSNETSKDPQQMRMAKIARFKREKEVKRKVREIRERIVLARRRGAGVDDDDEDEMEREHWTTTLRLYVLKALDHLDMLPQEMEMLKHMQGLKDGSIVETPNPNPRPPMKPIMLTKEMLRNGVFGHGYPSQPTMSVEEYGDQVVAHYRRDEAMRIAEGRPTRSGTGDEKKESDDEEETPESLKKARDWDEFKDDHPTGEGNRHNKG